MCIWTNKVYNIWIGTHFLNDFFLSLWWATFLEKLHNGSPLGTLLNTSNIKWQCVPLMGFQATTESNFVIYNLSCEKIRIVRKIKNEKMRVKSSDHILKSTQNQTLFDSHHLAIARGTKRAKNYNPQLKCGYYKSSKFQQIILTSSYPPTPHPTEAIHAKIFHHAMSWFLVLTFRQTLQP